MKRIKIKKSVKKIIISICSILCISICLLNLLTFIKKSILHNKQNLAYTITPSITLPLGSKRPVVEDFFENKSIEGEMNIYFNDWLIESDTLDEIGIYDVIITSKKEQYKAMIKVEDNEAPLLEVKKVTINPHDSYNVNTFILSCKDNSKEKCNVSFTNKQMASYKEEGEYDIEIIAKDTSNNEKIIKTSLTIANGSPTLSNENSWQEDRVNKTRIKENISEESKYGVKIITKESVMYETLEDGTDKRIKSKVTTEYDRNEYYATTEELQIEAKVIIEDNQDITKELLEGINNIRKELVLEELMLSERLTESATIRAIEIAWSGKYSHVRPNGNNFYTIHKDLGINNIILAESIVKDSKDVETVLENLKNEIGNYKSMTTDFYKYIGIGRLSENNNDYWVIHYAKNE